MGRNRIEYYSADFKAKQQRYYSSLAEKQARHFLAMEYYRLGKGSQRYLSEVFGCSRERIRQGLQELSACDFEPSYDRQRKVGGGRKKKRISTES